MGINGQLIRSLVGAIAFAVAIIGILVLGSLYSELSDQNEAALRDRTIDVSEIYSQEATRALGQKDLAGEATALPQQALQGLVDADLYYSGVNLYANGLGQPPAPPIKIDPSDLSTTKPKVVSFNIEGLEYRGFASPVLVDNAPVGAIILAQPESAFREGWSQIAVVFGVAGLCVIIGGFVLARNLARNISDPLLILTQACETIAEGNYDLPLPELTRKDELGNLARSFGTMSAELERAKERDRRFFLSITHELRTPLTSIRGHSQMMRDKQMTEIERLASLNAISLNASRLERLVGDIIDLARLRAGRFGLEQEDVPLHELVSGVAESLTGDVALEVGEVAEAEVFVDGSRVEQIITNVLSNAQRYAKSLIKVDTILDDGYYRIFMRNDGPGVGKEEQEQLFEPFYSKMGRGNMGLGLTLSRELAQRMGGDLTYTDDPMGACFILSLPLVPIHATKDHTGHTSN